MKQKFKVLVHPASSMDFSDLIVNQAFILKMTFSLETTGATYEVKDFKSKLVLYALKTSEKHKVFQCFQEVEKECIGKK